MQENFAYIPDNYFGSTDEEEKEDKEEEKEAEEQKEMIIKNVTKVINKITKKDIKEEKKEEFVPGIIINRYKLFCEYRTNFQNHFFHYLEKDFFDDTKKLINNSFLFIENRKTHLLNYDSIELQNISSNLDSSNFAESYTKVNSIIEDLLINFSSLKSLQQERIKPKFHDEELENKKIDKEIKKLILNMMKKIKFPLSGTDGEAGDERQLRRLPRIQLQLRRHGVRGEDRPGSGEQSGGLFGKEPGHAGFCQPCRQRPADPPRRGREMAEGHRKRRVCLWGYGSPRGVRLQRNASHPGDPLRSLRSKR